MTVVSLHTGLWGPRGRGSAHPKVADTRRPRPQGNTPEGVSPIIGPGTLPLQMPGATRNGDPWLAPRFPSQSPKRSDRWVLGTPHQVVVVVVVVVRTCVLHESVCPFPCAHASNSGGRTPGSKLPASPPPLPRPNGGGQPGPVPVHRALNPPSNSRLCMDTGTSKLSMNCATSLTKASVVAHNGHATTCTANVDHLINELQLGKLCGEGP